MLRATSFPALLALPLLAVGGVPGTTAGGRAAEGARVIRVNQLGYVPNAPKTAVMCALPDSSGTGTPPGVVSFVVEDTSGRRVLGPRRAAAAGAFGPCAQTYRLDFSAVRARGHYRLVAGDVRSPVVRVDARAYAGAADTLLYDMRQQRSGYNPTLRDSVHKLDGIIVDHPTRTGEFIGVSGG